MSNWLSFLTPNTQTMLAILTVGGFIVLVFVWLFHPPASENQAMLTVLNVLVGTLGTMAASVISYYFGASKQNEPK